MADSDSVALGQRWPRLTRREREVVLLVGVGISNKEIAQQLGLSAGTVKLHVHNIFQKTGARTRYELIVLMATQSSAAKPRVQVASDFTTTDGTAKALPDSEQLGAYTAGARARPVLGSP